MFKELMPLLRKRRLLLTISLVEGDTIRATVVPQKASETEDNALTTPLAITGTAEELDRDLPQQLVEFTGAHLQLQTTLACAKAEMDAAAKAAPHLAVLSAVERKNRTLAPIAETGMHPAARAGLRYRARIERQHAGGVFKTSDGGKTCDEVTDGDCCEWYPACL